MGSGTLPNLGGTSQKKTTLYVMYIYAMQSACDYACLRMYMYIYAMHLDCNFVRLRKWLCMYVHVIMITYAMQSTPN